MLISDFIAFYLCCQWNKCLVKSNRSPYKVKHKINKPKAQKKISSDSEFKFNFRLNIKALCINDFKYAIGIKIKDETVNISTAQKPIGRYKILSICVLTQIFKGTFLLVKKNGIKKIAITFNGGGAEIKNEYYLSNL